MSKIGLVVEGGGMKCAYSAGILDKFLDDDIHFSYCIGVSAGSANLASYLAKQRGRNLRFYTKWNQEPEFMGISSFFRTGQLFGLQYIYGTLTNSDGADFLNYEEIMNDPARFYLVTTNARTGQPVYLPKSMMKKDDYRPIMASSAIPAACHPIEIDGEKYFDGGVSDAIPVRRAIMDGCDKVVVISSKPRGYVKAPEEHRKIYKHLCRKYPEIIKDLDDRHIMYKRCQDYMFKLEKTGKAFLFMPSLPLPMGTGEKSAKKNHALYDLALYDYVKFKKGLLNFMKD